MSFTFLRRRLAGIRRLVMALLLLAVLAGCAGGRFSERPEPAGLLVQSTVNLAPPSPPPPPPPPPSVKLVFVGDIMLARRPGEAAARGADPFADFARVLMEADLAIGNLECVVATVGQRVPKAYNFRCHPRTVPLLARYFGAVSVANNHSGDYGKEALTEQLDLLDAAGLAYFGGGRDSREAHTPRVLEHNGLRIALLGYNDVELRSYEAGLSTPGLAWADEAAISADIANARSLQGADLVVVSPHWGIEYQSKPSERQRTLARKMIDAGADLVVGTHPHVTQTVEWYRDRLIVYSLGNFVFDDFVDVGPDLQEPSRISWVLRVSLRQGAVLSWSTLVARTDDQGIPRQVPGAVSPCGRPQPAEAAQCKSE